MAGPEANIFFSENGRKFFRSREFWQGLMDEFGGEKSLINTDGETHLRLRKVMAKGFSRTVVKDQYDNFLKITNQILDNEWENENTICILPKIQRLVAEQLGVLTMGQSPGEYTEDIRFFINNILSVSVIKAKPKFFLKTKKYKKVKARCIKFANKMVNDYKFDDDNSSKSKNLLDDIMYAHRENPDLFTHNELIMAVLGPYFAGLDTVANVLSSTLYAIIKDPDVYEKVTKDVENLFTSSNLDFNSLKEQKYLWAAMMEGLRMYSIALSQQRNAAQDFEFNGYLVKEGEAIMTSVIVSHFLETLYKEPKKFDIYRYLDGRKENKQPGAWAPFGLGSHTCLGSTLAEVQIMINIAVLLKRFKISLLHKDYTMVQKLIPTLGPKNSFKMKLISRTK